jgi:hypothetical protein
MTTLTNRTFGWLHSRAILKIDDIKVFHLGLLTEYAGHGEVLALAFLGGAGYIPSPSRRDSTWVRGFTVYIRLRRSTARTYDPNRKTFPAFLVTTNPNGHTVSNVYC